MTDEEHYDSGRQVRQVVTITLTEYADDNSRRFYMECTPELANGGRVRWDDAPTVVRFGNVCALAWQVADVFGTGWLHEMLRGLVEQAASAEQADADSQGH